MLVLLFHAGVIDNGFLGVDVFFVLSGFLISNVLWDEYSADARASSAIASFLTKRAKRLLPLSIVVLIATAVIASFAFDTLTDSWKTSAGAALLWSQNWFLIGEANDYFASEGTNPFQHYWSLGIEEQFYLLVPVLTAGFMAASRRLTEQVRLARFAVLISVGIGASLLANTIGAYADEASAYYATHTRAYQLLAGCIAMVVVRSVRIASTSSSMALVCLAGIVGISIQAEWPLFWLGAVTTVLTTVLIISAERLEITVPFADRIGRLSYGIYLWHFPISLYLTNEQTGIHPVAVFVMVATGSIALSSLSLRVLEEPLRYSTAGGRRTFVAASAAISIAFAVILVVPDAVDEPVYAAESSSEAVGPLATSVQQAAESASARLEAADVKELDGWVDLMSTSVAVCGHVDTSDSCVDSEGDPRVLLIGDSFANQAYHGFRALADQEGWSFGAFTRPGCPWMFGLYDDTGNKDLCTASKPVLQQVLATMRPSVVILHGYPYAFSTSLTSIEGGHAVDGPELIAEARQTISSLQASGSRVIFLESTPFPDDGSNPALCLRRARWADECDYISRHAEDPLAVALRSDAALDSALDVITINHLLCEGNRCSADVAGYASMADSTHVSGGVFVLLRNELRVQLPSDLTS